MMKKMLLMFTLISTMSYSVHADDVFDEAYSGFIENLKIELPNLLLLNMPDRFTELKKCFLFGQRIQKFNENSFSIYQNGSELEKYIGEPAYVSLLSSVNDIDNLVSSFVSKYCSKGPLDVEATRNWVINLIRATYLATQTIESQKPQYLRAVYGIEDYAKVLVRELELTDDELKNILKIW